MDTSPYLTVVIPTYQEHPDTLVEIYDRIKSTLRGMDYSVIVVDDTSDLLHLRPMWFDYADIVLRGEKRGLSSAVLEGIKMTNSRYVAVLDGDLQHPPELLSDMLLKVKKGHDIVVARKYGYVHGISWFRRVVSRVFNIAAHIFLPETWSLGDPMSGYFLFERSKIDVSKIYDPRGFKILLYILHYGKFEHPCEVSMTFGKRVKGQSKAGVKEALTILRQILRLSISKD